MPDPIVAALLSGFVGVIVGGLITYLATSAVESQKWERQEEGRRHAEVREALILAMDWLEPIESAVDNATAATFLGLADDVLHDLQWNREHLLDDWPDLRGELDKMRLRPSARCLLSPAVYEGQKPIFDKLLEMRVYGEELAVEIAGMAQLKADSGSLKATRADDLVKAQERHIQHLKTKLQEQWLELRHLASDYREMLEKEYKAAR